MNYQQELEASKNDPEGFWKEKSEALEWFKSPQKILTQDKEGIHHWFADGEMNTAYMALDYHVENGRADQPDGAKRQHRARQTVQPVDQGIKPPPPLAEFGAELVQGRAVAGHFADRARLGVFAEHLGSFAQHIAAVAEHRVQDLPDQSHAATLC